MDPAIAAKAPGLYPICFFATLETGTRLEARGLLTVIADKEIAMTSAVASIGVTLADAPRGSPLYREALWLREALLRKPLGLSITEEELADDARRRHFCALANGAVIGTASMRPLGAHTLQLKQMAVAPEWCGKGVGARLLAHAEAWARSQEYAYIILNARIGAEGFYAKHGYVARGEPFEENTIPHIRMTKRI